MIFEHTSKINGININWTDGTENEGRNIVSMDTGSGPQPVNLPIPESMQTLPDIADILYVSIHAPVEGATLAGSALWIRKRVNYVFMWFKALSHLNKRTVHGKKSE